MKLFEIAREYEDILAELYDEDGNENPQALARLEENHLNLQSKSIAIASWIKNMEVEKASLTEAKKQIDIAKKNVLDREKRLQAQIERWNGYLKENMERRGINEIKCPYFVLKTKKNPPSVNDYDQSQIPDEYWIIERRFNRQLALQHMKVGVIIPGAELKQETRLEIK